MKRSMFYTLTILTGLALVLTGATAFAQTKAAPPEGGKSKPLAAEKQMGQQPQQKAMPMTGQAQKESVKEKAATKGEKAPAAKKQTWGKTKKAESSKKKPASTNAKMMEKSGSEQKQSPTKEATAKPNKQ